jgi:hypothetical protein
MTIAELEMLCMRAFSHRARTGENIDPAIVSIMGDLSGMEIWALVGLCFEHSLTDAAEMLVAFSREPEPRPDPATFVADWIADEAETAARREQEEQEESA